jgi:hypothetical protein
MKCKEAGEVSAAYSGRRLGHDWRADAVIIKLLKWQDRCAFSSIVGKTEDIGYMSLMNRFSGVE